MFLFSSQFIKATDFIVAPILGIVLFLLSFLYSKKKYNNKYLVNYFRLGLLVRLLGCLIISFISQYYYEVVDTYYYYTGALSLNTVYFVDIHSTFTYLWNDSAYLFENGFDRNNFGDIYNTHTLLGIETSLFMMKIGAIIGFLTFNTYLGTSLLLALFAFGGAWKIFRLFYYLYPDLHKEIAIATLFIPSVIIWSSNYSKDTIVMGSIGFLLNSSYCLYVKKERIFFNTLLIILSSYIIIKIKLYLFIAFMPAIFSWVALTHIKRIKNTKKKLVLYILLPIITAIFGVFCYINLTNLAIFKDHYSLEKVAGTTSQIISKYDEINTKNNQQEKFSNFTIGKFEPTILGMLNKAPHAILATLYRPYIWEAHKITHLPSAIENTLLLLFTLWVFLRKNILNRVYRIFENPDIMFCFMVTIIIAFIVGIGTANFGSLVRYKIPCIPFFLIGLFILNSKPVITETK